MGQLQKGTTRVPAGQSVFDARSCICCPLISQVPHVYPPRRSRVSSPVLLFVLLSSPSSSRPRPPLPPYNRLFACIQPSSPNPPPPSTSGIPLPLTNFRRHLAYGKSPAHEKEPRKMSITPEANKHRLLLGGSSARRPPEEDGPPGSKLTERRYSR